jgi:hypothetical protein
MNEKRAKHCLTVFEDTKSTFNKLILAIGGISINHVRDPYLKQIKERVKDLETVEMYSVNEGTWERFNAKL